MNDLRDFFGAPATQVLPILDRKGYKVTAEAIGGGTYLYIKAEGGEESGEPNPVALSFRRDEARKLAHALLYLADS